MNDVSNVVLEATGVQYQMSFDEAAFFEWLNKIPSVDSYQGQRFTLYIKVIVDTLDEDALNELAALYRRYRIDPRAACSQHRAAWPLVQQPRPLVAQRSIRHRLNREGRAAPG